LNAGTGRQVPDEYWAQVIGEQLVVVVVPVVVLAQKHRSVALAHATESKLATVHPLNWAQVPTVGVVTLVPGVNAQSPSVPLPWQAA
jgi:hypothetical protein